MDRDGTGIGFDLELTGAISDAVNVPVIASGGVGEKEHFCEARNVADAFLAASVFHFGKFSIYDVKEAMQNENILVRL